MHSDVTSRDIGVYDLKKIVQETLEFNPTIILKKGEFQIEPLVEIHRYIAGLFNSLINVPI